MEVTFMQMTKEGTYTVEGKKVKVTLGGETHVLTVGDNGCLEGGGILGRYCKNGGGGSRSVATGSGLSRTYKAGDAEASLILDFQNGQKVLVTMAEARGAQESVDATYEIKGDQITLTVPGSVPLVLTRKGEALEGAVEGHRMTFVKR